MRSLMLALTGALLGLAALVAPTQAQVARGGGESQRAVQQLAAERTALKAENERLKRELEAAKARTESAAAAAASAKSRIAAAEGTAARLGQTARSEGKELEETRAKLAELVTRYRELAGNLSQVETDRVALQNAAARQKRDVERCAAANVELFAIADDMLTRFESTRRSDPFTQLARVRAENLVDEYRAQMAEQRVVPSSPAAPAAEDPARR